jgi:phospholipid/cholesterol/gamma-HCH transport system substrate-binding protein
MDRAPKAQWRRGKKSMETDKHYFIEGLFIIVLSVGAALAFVWLSGSGHRDDVLYRMHFDESVSGLSVGDPVKFRGVDVGSVKALSLVPDDPRLVQVDVELRKDAPVKTDTKASLKLKGITGVVFIELNGGSPDAKTLLAATPEGQVPEIPAEKSTLTTLVEALPKAVERFLSIESQTKKVLSDVGAVTGSIKENPSQLIFGPKSKTGASSEKADTAAKQKGAAKRQDGTGQ